MFKYVLSLFVFVFISACNDGSKTPTSSEAQSKLQDSSARTIHLVHDVPVFTDENLVNVIVEIPAGTTEKWEVSKTTGQLFLEQIEGKGRKVNYLAYPTNYGMIPQTLLSEANGGDGDPLDVVVLGEAFEQGSIVPCRLIGVIELLDSGEQDDKLIAVPIDGNFAHIRDIDQLVKEYPGIIDILTIWFNHYKGDKIKVLTVSNADRAQHILKAAIQDYQIDKAK